MQERPRTIHGMIHTKWPGCEVICGGGGRWCLCRVSEREVHEGHRAVFQKDTHMAPLMADEGMEGPVR